MPKPLIGRYDELQEIRHIFAADGDLLIAGVPGSGRRSLIRRAAVEMGARVVEIDCLRAITSSRFLKLLAESIVGAFADASEMELMERWSKAHPLIVERSGSRSGHLVWHVPVREEWVVLEALLELPQFLAESLDCRVVLVFQNFPHIRSWDRTGQWEEYLRREVRRQSRVSYVVIATVPEPWAYESQMQVITLPPLARPVLQEWAIATMAEEGFKFEDDALNLFLTYVEGHIGDAIALARRIWLECRALGHAEPLPNPFLIQTHHVHRSVLSLVEDLSLTYEALLLQLPPIQARVLESLAIDPTDSPHSRNYLQRHQLSRGGGLQGALIGLEQKGLVYGSRYGYRVAMPLLSFWLKHQVD